jgi:N6-L-threonylcarbamoyladenine synthase
MNYILAIETSCDETAAAVVQTDGLILSNIVASQIDTHKEYGGVIPEIASRMHVEAINIAIDQALKQANKTIKEIDAIAVTYGPGLLGSLLIGLQAAKTMAFIHNLPLIGVNHMEGHIYANFLRLSADAEPVEVPAKFLCLVVSGGHTQIVIGGNGHYETIGRTHDDAAGESYDKVARLLQLGYPGGPIVDTMAKLGDPSIIKFAVGRIKDGNPLDFSFSGLKTGVLNYYRKNPTAKKEDICASFQNAVVEALVEKTIHAALDNQLRNVYLAGGVAANSTLRETLVNRGKENGLSVSIPPFKLCTDNAAMIGGAAIPKFLRKEFSTLTINAEPGLKL